MINQLVNCCFSDFFAMEKRCGPCRYFTPQLKRFYHEVNNASGRTRTPTTDGSKYNNHVEVIFVSFDKTMSSFHQYYSTMPWLSIPIPTNSRQTAQNKNFIQHLSSSFWVNSIPTLVVLTNDGLFVTNNAKADISNLMSSGGSPHLLLDSWKNIQPVPIDKAYLGVIP